VEKRFRLPNTLKVTEIPYIETFRVTYYFLLAVVTVTFSFPRSSWIGIGSERQKRTNFLLRNKTEKVEKAWRDPRSKRTLKSKTYKGIKDPFNKGKVFSSFTLRKLEASLSAATTAVAWWKWIGVFVQFRAWVCKNWIIGKIKLKQKNFFIIIQTLSFPFNKVTLFADLFETGNWISGKLYVVWKPNLSEPPRIIIIFWARLSIISWTITRPWSIFYVILLRLRNIPFNVVIWGFIYSRFTGNWIFRISVICSKSCRGNKEINRFMRNNANLWRL